MWRVSLVIRVLQEQREHKGHLDPRGLPDLADLRVREARMERMGKLARQVRGEIKE